MIEIKAPTTDPWPLQHPRIFLAGTIDMGNSYDWQADVAAHFADKDVVLFNPRRDDWDSSWKQTIHDPQFKQQVTWEMDHLEMVDAILMHFGETSQSPITLLELGLYAASGKLVISCPPGFWRRGNVEMVSARYKIPLYKHLRSALEHLEIVLDI